MCHPSKLASRVRFPGGVRTDLLIQSRTCYINSVAHENYNAYMRQYMKDWYDRRRAAAIAQLGGCCTVCGTTEDLQFDHIDRTTKVAAISNLWTASEEKFQIELAKCQLLCIEHHKEKTLSEFAVPHGGGVSGRRNCPCEPCKEKKKEYMREYNSRYRIVKTGRSESQNIYGGPGRYGTVTEHGAGTRGIKGCKCDLCRGRYNEYMRDRKQQRSITSVAEDPTLNR